MQGNVQRRLEICGVFVAYIGYRTEVGLKFPYLTSYLLTLHSFLCTYRADSHVGGLAANGATEMGCVRSKTSLQKELYGTGCRGGLGGTGWRIVEGAPGAAFLMGTVTLYNYSLCPSGAKEGLHLIKEWRSWSGVSGKHHLMLQWKLAAVENFWKSRPCLDAGRRWLLKLCLKWAIMCLSFLLTGNVLNPYVPHSIPKWYV